MIFTTRKEDEIWQNILVYEISDKSSARCSLDAWNLDLGFMQL
jgi:hypothetical protein